LFSGGLDVSKKKAVLNSAIVLYFVICFEILIMISPFAGFFYSAFNPVLLGLARYPATKWLSAFFFTHMVVPPNAPLKVVRVMGSILFLLGIAAFLICAVQVYWHKFLKRGAVLKGLYRWIRHPQYLALAIAGAGLAILWPRFIVVVLWLVMVLVYYALSKDEERRMLGQYPETYSEYMQGTGMFLPKSLECLFAFTNMAGKAGLFAVLAICAIGGAFLLRQYTIRHLPLWTDSKVVALAVLPEDEPMMQRRMPEILKVEEVRSRLGDNASYVAYFLPTNYVMQGLIADTGGDWRLYKHHHSISRFSDWIFHPFGHLGGMQHSVFEPTHHSEHSMAGGSVRRIIFLRVSNVAVTSPGDVFAVNAVRTPDFMIDLDVHSLNMLEMKALPVKTAWGTMPTPAF
jgi:protein-S-isoprenylcysteine O-methyltransferase Ste14